MVVAFSGICAVSLAQSAAPPSTSAAPVLLQVPAFTSPVVDQAGLLSDSERTRLEQRLLLIQRAPGPQIAVLLVATLSGEPIEQFSMRVAESWKLGTAKKDDGALLVVARDDHAVRIEVGQGLEGDVPDVVASRIIRGVLTPSFRDGQFYQGLMTSVDAIAAAAGVTSLPDSGVRAPNYSSGRSRGAGRLVFLLIFFVFFVFRNMGRRNLGRRGYGGFGGGGLGGGGFGGGGFGGGGGGGFSGGGSSGRW